MILNVDDIKNVVLLISRLNNTKCVYMGDKFFMDNVDNSTCLINSIDLLIEDLEQNLQSLIDR